MKFLGILALFAVSLGLNAQAPRRAPSFALPDSSLKMHDILDYRGKVLLIDFMRTDCPKCMELSTTLEQMQRKFGQKIAVLSVVTYPPDNQGTVKKFIASQGVSAPVLFDCGQVTASYAQATPNSPTVHLPRLYIVDAKGMIAQDLDYDEDTEKLKPGTLAPLIESALTR